METRTWSRYYEQLLWNRYKLVHTDLAGPTLFTIVLTPMIAVIAISAMHVTNITFAIPLSSGMFAMHAAHAKFGMHSLPAVSAGCTRCAIIAMIAGQALTVTTVMIVSLVLPSIYECNIVAESPQLLGFRSRRSRMSTYREQHFTSRHSSYACSGRLYPIYLLTTRFHFGSS